MKGYRALILTLTLIAQLSSATTVNVTVSPNKFGAENEMTIHLEIHPTEDVGGELNIFKVDGNRLVLVHQPYRKPVPGSCYGCRRDLPLSTDFSDDFHFVPKEDGLYRVEANFGGVKDTVEFRIGRETTSTTTLPKTTSIEETTTTVESTSTIVITPSSSSTTTIGETATPETSILVQNAEKEGNGSIPAVLLAVAIAAILTGRRVFKRSRR
jgi:hypothetical protein